MLTNVAIRRYQLPALGAAGKATSLQSRPIRPHLRPPPSLVATAEDGKVRSSDHARTLESTETIGASSEQRAPVARLEETLDRDLEFALLADTSTRRCLACSAT
jgi:hypothetical protein